MARQLARTDVDYAAVGEAGKVQNYEGEALAAIGTIIGEAISNIKINQDKVDGQEEEINSIEVPNVAPPETFDGPGEFEYDFRIPPAQTEMIDKKIDQPLPPAGGGKIPPYKTAFEGFSAKTKGIWATKDIPGNTGFDKYHHHMTVQLPEQQKQAKETVRSWAKSKPKGFVYDPQNIAHVNEFKALNSFT